MTQTLFRKIWDAHLVSDGVAVAALDRPPSRPRGDEPAGVRGAAHWPGRPVRRPDLTVATMDHNVPTTEGPIVDPLAKQQLDTLRANCEEFGVRLFATGSGREGIVHVIGPELGLSQPGMTIVCGDRHTSTHGAFGALAFGIGTSEVEHVLATQTLPQSLPKTMQVDFVGDLPFGLTAKDMVLAAIGELGVAGGRGHVIEYTGAAIRALSMEGRMTVCNMSIEAGARAGPDRAGRHDAPVSHRPAGLRRDGLERSARPTTAPRTTRCAASTCRGSRRRSRGGRTPAWSRRSTASSRTPPTIARPTHVTRSSVRFATWT